MFESAEQVHVVEPKRFAVEQLKLREKLLEVQLELVQRRQFATLVIVSGLDGAGKGQAIQRLYEWLDPRHLRTSAYGEPTEEERLRPRLWRYWRDLPPKGEIGVVFGSWYNQPFRDRILGHADTTRFEHDLLAINRFEELLANEGALILKFWFHLSTEQQKARLEQIQSGPGGRHVIEEWTGVQNHEAVLAAGTEMARVTSTGHAPWVVVPSGDGLYRDLAMGRIILESIRKRLEAPPVTPQPMAPAVIASVDKRTVLDALDLNQKLARDDYDRRLVELQDRLAELTDREAARRFGVVMVFEGSDAAGKGGAIRRVTAAFDPRRFQVHPIAAPSDEERAQPYLWRFWRRLPREGHIAVFDRSWYGRVLVERVEGFANEAEWLRAYNEINDFEAQLTAGGILILKFWLAISKDEQLKRFKDREKTAFKRHKITEEDWRNRKRWSDYANAVNDMVDRTSTPAAPWTLVEAENKRFGRIKILETLCTRLEHRFAS